MFGAQLVAANWLKMLSTNREKHQSTSCIDFALVLLRLSMVTCSSLFFCDLFKLHLSCCYWPYFVTLAIVLHQTIENTFKILVHVHVAEVMLSLMVNTGSEQGKKRKRQDSTKELTNDDITEAVQKRKKKAKIADIIFKENYPAISWSNLISAKSV